jgi:hypothetical protein
MKNRILITTCLGLVFGPSALVMGFGPSANPSLPNYDKRAAAPAARQAAPASTNALPDPTAALLNSRVPGVRIRRDDILGMPRQITAARGFLTGPEGRGLAVSDAHLDALPADDPHLVIKAFLNEHSALVGHDASLLTSAQVQRDYVTGHNGLHTTVWVQTLEDIPVFDGLLIGNVTHNGELATLSSQFVPDVTSAANAGNPGWKSLVTAPTISAAQALVRAASNIGAVVAEDSIAVVAAEQGGEKRQTLNAPNLSLPAGVQLVWLPMNRDLVRLCWRVVLGAVAQPEQYLVVVDAESGEVLVRRSLTAHISPATYNVYTNDSPTPFSPGSPTPSSFQPPPVSRVMRTLSALDTNASPAGWINDGDNETRGNNADAFVDRNLDGSPDGPRPQGVLPNRVFNFPLNLITPPLSYSNASTVQLFYQANWYHDQVYKLGFTEAAGNFQLTNFNRGGLGNDNIICLVQAGADVGFADNATFSTPPDGNNGVCSMFVFNGPNPDRDGSLDQEVVIHELTHGLSGRLLGGGVGIFQLQSAGMGEGWSDFYALCLLSAPTDDVNGNYAAGAYVTYQIGGSGFTTNYYFGIRRYPYTTDMSKNPLTFKDIDPTKASPHPGIPINPLFGGGDPAEVHAQGEVWCVTLREIWASLVTKYGWTNGNQIVLQLVTDGLKLAPANANFLEARDAILLADAVSNGDENFVELWTAFAKRGMGFSAVCPPSTTTIGVEEAYDMPVAQGILQTTVTPPPYSSFFTGDLVPIFLRVADPYPITNATIAATVGGTNLVFRNDGIAPDVRGSNSTYSALFQAPTNPVPVTITMVVSAPDKLTITNVVTYFVVAPPPNDHFTNAAKVPAAGTNYLTSNRRATLETGEPVHAGVGSVVASLWWNYIPTASATNVLVDTGLSDFRTVVAVYTNNSLATLQPVVSAVGNASRLGAFAYITNAQVGVTYHIAVSAYSTNNLNKLGTLSLNIAPNGVPDTNAPSVTVLSPLSGVTVDTNRMLLTGTAVDPGSNPSGIKQISVSISAVPGFGEVTTSVVNPIPAFGGPSSSNWSRTISLLAGLNSIRVQATDFAGNRSAPFILQATYRPQEPINDYFANAIALNGPSGVGSVNTTKATKEVGEPYHAGLVGGHSAWWTFVPSADGALTLSTSNSTFDTVLAIYTGTNVSQLTPVASNDDVYDGVPGGFSQIVQAVKADQTYRIAVDGYDGASGVVFLGHSFVPAAIYSLTISNTSGGQVTPSSGNVVGNATVVLTATPAEFFEFANWTGSFTSTANPLSVVVSSNISLTANFQPVSYEDDFESGNLSKLSWLSAGGRPWFVQTNTVYAGSFSARSGDIGNGQSSSLILATNFAGGAGSFYFKVSSEGDWDFLSFHVDGAQLQKWSGEVAWANFTFPLTAGSHTLEWRYSKDASLSEGLDAAFLDNVDLPLAASVDTTSPALLQLLVGQGGGGLTLQLQGQPNQLYVIQATTDFTSWQSVSTNFTTDGVIRFVDPSPAANPFRFYRAIVP